jgi:2-oxoglutarate dehydrogenase E1 component
VLDDPWASSRAAEVTRVVLCTGKLYYDLLAEAEKLTERRPAIVRLEQLYSFPWSEAREVLARYPRLEELVWVQEEPRNMGAWSYLAPKLEELAPAGVVVGYIGRPERASPAEGYPAAHAAEQSRIIREALEGGRSHPALPTMAAAGESKG